MRELGGMAYADMADALGVSVPAVKSLLVRARIALAQALEARDTACSDIRGQLIARPRPWRAAQRHGPAPHARLQPTAAHFHGELRGVSRRFAALAPTVGPMGVIAKVLGIGGGAGGGGEQRRDRRGRRGRDRRRDGISRTFRRPEPATSRR